MLQVTISGVGLDNKSITWCSNLVAVDSDLKESWNFWNPAIPLRGILEFWNPVIPYHTTDTGILGEQIHQSLLRYSTTTTTQAIAKTLCIVDTDIKHYVTKQFLQVQQPVESDLEKYKDESNNSATAQAKSTVNKKPRFLFLTTPLYHQTPQSRIVFNPPLETQSETPRTSGNPHFWNQYKENTSTWEQPPAQNPAEPAFPLTEETAILQPSGLNNKGKQPALASGKHSNMQTPTPLNITSNTSPINQIMLEKFSEEEDNAYLWIAKAKKAITVNNWDDDRAIQDYYTVAQVLNQFIKGLQNSILRSVRPHHLANLQDTITLACDFEFTEQEPELQEPIDHHNGEKITTTDTYSNRIKKDHGPKSRKPISATKILAKHNIPISHISKSTTPICTTSSNYYQLPPMTQAISHYPTPSYSPSRPRAIDYNQGWRNSNNNQVQTNTPTRYLNQASYLGLTKDQGRDVEQISKPSKQTKSNIPPATITENTTLATIFSFNIDNLNTHSLFSETAINQNKPITTLYTDARVGGINIKLILDSRSAVDHATTARIITVNRNTKTPIGEIDNFSFKINGI
ncbi:hypothetical protein G9A89_018854 [Geosiphon pyriformis]|nr:hypothetical protein G9A89_018854 [Geosiphon pyriformis]